MSLFSFFLFSVRVANILTSFSFRYVKDKDSNINTYSLFL
nr:MAG TPA: hypothetical protein [Caudoviricetes sp.]